MKTTMAGTPEEGYMPDETPDPALLAALVDDMAPLRPSRPEAFEVHALGVPTHMAGFSVGSRVEVLLELAGIKAAIRTWYDKQPDQVLREAAAYSARLTEMWTECRIIEANDRMFLQVRTMQVDPVLKEVDRQFEFAKSRIAMQRQDLDLAIRGGGI